MEIRELRVSLTFCKTVRGRRELSDTYQFDT